jgi:hypothetical protein
MQKLLFALAFVAGGFITYVDTRPGWDDTGVTAGAIFLVCAVRGALGPKRPWLWALAVGLWIPVLGIAQVDRNYAALLALLVAFAGAYAGRGVRRMLASPNTPPTRGTRS